MECLQRPRIPAKKLTLFDQNSFAAPGLALFSGQLWLSWAGTDQQHSLNVLPLSIPGLTRGVQTILAGLSSSVGPKLSVFTNGSTSHLILNWSTPARHLNLATSVDGSHFSTNLGTAGLPQLSTSAPSSLFTPREGGPEYWLAWTGTDPAQHLNLQWTTQYPQWPDPATTRTVLQDTALGGPQITFDAGFLISWTGTDPDHHLNVAQFDGF